MRKFKNSRLASFERSDEVIYGIITGWIITIIFDWTMMFVIIRHLVRRLRERDSSCDC